MNPLELIAFIEANVPETEQLNALALLADPPGEDFIPKARLPVVNELPAYHVGAGGLGTELAGTNYGVAAPVIGQEVSTPTPSIGELLTGDLDGTF